MQPATSTAFGPPFFFLRAQISRIVSSDSFREAWRNPHVLMIATSESLGSDTTRKSLESSFETRPSLSTRFFGQPREMSDTTRRFFTIPPFYHRFRGTRRDAGDARCRARSHEVRFRSFDPRSRSEICSVVSVVSVVKGPGPKREART